jgi:hypothetical protein
MARRGFGGGSGQKKFSRKMTFTIHYIKQKNPTDKDEVFSDVL